VFPTPKKSVSITSQAYAKQMTAHYYAVNSDIFSCWQHHMVSDFVLSQAMAMLMEGSGIV